VSTGLHDAVCPVDQLVQRTGADYAWVAAGGAAGDVLEWKGVTGLLDLLEKAFDFDTSGTQSPACDDRLALCLGCLKELPPSSPEPMSWVPQVSRSERRKRRRSPSPVGLNDSFGHSNERPWLSQHGPD
jgi:hypothetical protein